MDKWIDGSTATVYIDRVTVVVVLIHNLLLFMKVVYDNSKKKELSPTSQNVNLLYYVTIITVASFFIYMISQIFSVFEFWYDSLGCSGIIIIGVILFYFGKYCTWIFSLLRLKIVFHKKSSSSFGNNGYSGKFLIILIIVLTLNTLLLIGLIIFYVRAQLEYIPNTNLRWCFMNADKYTIIIFIVLDSFGTYICFYLFYRKMKLLETNAVTIIASEISTQTANKSTTLKVEIHAYNENKNETKIESTETQSKKKTFDADLIYIIRKYAVLSATAILSTIFMNIFISFTALSLSFVAMDTAVNCWCIVLFDPRYDNIYRKMFSCIAYSNKIKKKQREIEMSKQLVVSLSRKLSVTGTVSKMTNDEKHLSQIIQNVSVTTNGVHSLST
eukprot:491491_1